MAAQLWFMMPLDSMASLSPVKNILFVSHLRKQSERKDVSKDMEHLNDISRCEDGRGDSSCSFIRILTRTRPMNAHNWS